MANTMAAIKLHMSAARPSMRHCSRTPTAARCARQAVSAAAHRPHQEGWEAAAAGPSSGLLRLACAVAGSGLLLAGPAHAEKVAEFATSGFLFKDTVEVVMIDDKEAPGVQIYLTDVNRSITEKARPQRQRVRREDPPAALPVAVPAAIPTRVSSVLSCS